MKHRAGIDISHYQKWSENTLRQLFEASDFVLHKATQHDKHVDSKFVGRAKLAQELDVYWGAYHFYDPRSRYTPKAQADHFVDTVNSSARPAILICDLEQLEGQLPSLKDAEQFIARLMDITGRQPIIYGNVGDLDKIIGNRNTILTQCPLWIAHWGEAEQPNLPNGWSGYKFWQYTSNPHDCDFFNGSLEELNTFWMDHCYRPGAGNPKPLVSLPLSLPNNNDSFFPHAFPNQSCPQGRALNHYHLPALFNKMIEEGNPLFLKATVGVDYENPAFHNRAVRLFQYNQQPNHAPLVWGAWHQFSTKSDSDPKKQALDFLNSIEKAAKAAHNANTPVLLAVTLGEYKGCYPTLENIRIFLETIYEEKAIRVMIQGNPNGLETIFKNNQQIALSDYPLYLQHWSDSPRLPRLPRGCSPWEKYSFWERNSSAQFQFNGSQEALMRLWRTTGYRLYHQNMTEDADLLALSSFRLT